LSFFSHFFTVAGPNAALEVAEQPWRARFKSELNYLGLPHSRTTAEWMRADVCRLAVVPKRPAEQPFGNARPSHLLISTPR
jgi:hypothetical protein